MNEQVLKTHDYSVRCWGHDYHITQVIDRGQRLHALGWGEGIKCGDYLILCHPEGGTTRYQVEAISYYSNPHDMWSAKLKFAPRQKNNSQERGHK